VVAIEKSGKKKIVLAMKRVVQAGAKPVTALSVMLKWQRDWAERDTYDAVIGIVKNHLARTAWVSSTPTRWCTALRRRSSPNTSCLLPPGGLRKKQDRELGRRARATPPSAPGNDTGTDAPRVGGSPGSVDDNNAPGARAQRSTLE
jgi:hypothetical protein